MKFRIDLRPVLTDPLHDIRIILYIILFAGLFLPLQRELLQRAGWGHSFDGANPLFTLVPPPAILAGGIEVQEGIHHFNGKSSRGVWSGQTTYVLASIVFTYILGPALFSWGLLARARRRQSPSAKTGITSIATALTLGGMSLISIIPAPMHAVTGYETYRTMVRDCQVSAIQDDISDDLFQMARRAQVIYFLPGEMGGGNQSWLARDGSGNPVIDISRIGIPSGSPSHDPEHSAAKNGRVYSLYIERADSLTIRGVNGESNVEAADGSGESVHAGKVEVCIGVTPDRVNVVFIN